MEFSERAMMKLESSKEVGAIAWNTNTDFGIIYTL